MEMFALIKAKKYWFVMFHTGNLGNFNQKA